MDFFTIIAEDKIKRAYKEGEFDKLPGMGKPIQLDDLSHVPDDLKMAYRLLKNAGMLDNETELKKEMMRIEDLLKSCQDEAEEAELEKKLSKKQYELDQLFHKRKTFESPASAFYKEKVMNKIERHKQ